MATLAVMPECLARHVSLVVIDRHQYNTGFGKSLAL